MASHEVTAFMRDESKLGVEHERLKAICGEALNALQVESAVRGSEAVFSTLGPRGKPAVMAAGATQNIVSTMEKRGVERLVVVSVPGIAVRVPRPTNGPGTGSFKAFFGSASPSMKVTRADLADFMLKQLTDDSWIRQAPILSN